MNELSLPKRLQDILVNQKEPMVEAVHIRAALPRHHLIGILGTIYVLIVPTMTLATRLATLGVLVGTTAFLVMKNTLL